MIVFKVIADLHDRLAVALRGKSGVLTNKEVQVAYAEAFPELADRDVKWAIAADHCDNHSNTGSCRRCRSGQAILHRLGRNAYKVRA